MAKPANYIKQPEKRTVADWREGLLGVCATLKEIGQSAYLFLHDVVENDGWPLKRQAARQLLVELNDLEG